MEHEMCTGIPVEQQMDFICNWYFLYTWWQSVWKDITYF
jgi:hypothetical protein